MKRFQPDFADHGSCTARSRSRMGFRTHQLGIRVGSTADFPLIKTLAFPKSRGGNSDPARQAKKRKPGFEQSCAKSTGRSCPSGIGPAQGEKPNAARWLLMAG